MDDLYSELKDDVAGNPQLEQQLISQLRQVKGSIAKIKASNLVGTAHPIAVLYKVQDTWGNSLVRKRTAGLDGFPKQHKRQKQTGSSHTAAEPEAQPFSKPVSVRNKSGPRQQAKAASADKENSPAAANANSSAIVPVTAGPSQSAKPPKGPTSRCSHLLEQSGEEGMPA
ncbi:TPA: hypothetical protein ACH3X1_004921 [Trebouxia sp. C0004]